MKSGCIYKSVKYPARGIAMEYNVSRGDKSISRDKLAEINQLPYKFQIYFRYALIKLPKVLFPARKIYSATAVVVIAIAEGQNIYMKSK